MRFCAWMSVAAVAAGMAGCCSNRPDPGKVPVPEQLRPLLANEIRITHFSKLKLDAAGRIIGIDARIEATNSFETSTNVVGQFRFEAYAFRPNSAEPKGPQIAIWDVPFADVPTNAAHWDSFKRTYLFRLQLEQAIAPGEPLVLVAVFTSPFTDRLMDERTFEGE